MIVCPRALALVGELGVHRVRIALNCLSNVSDIHQSSGGRNASMIKEIGKWCKKFQEATFAHEGHCSNLEEHKVACYALSFSFWSPFMDLLEICPRGNNKMVIIIFCCT